MHNKTRIFTLLVAAISFDETRKQIQHNKRLEIEMKDGLLSHIYITKKNRPNRKFTRKTK